MGNGKKNCHKFCKAFVLTHMILLGVDTKDTRFSKPEERVSVKIGPE